MWQHVSTSKVHIQTSGMKYIKGIVYNGIQFLLCILYHWPEGDPLESKHIATLKIQHLLAVFVNLYLSL